MRSNGKPWHVLASPADRWAEPASGLQRGCQAFQARDRDESFSAALHLVADAGVFEVAYVLSDQGIPVARFQVDQRKNEDYPLDRVDAYISEGEYAMSQAAIFDIGAPEYIRDNDDFLREFVSEIIADRVPWISDVSRKRTGDRRETREEQYMRETLSPSSRPTSMPAGSRNIIGAYATDVSFRRGGRGWEMSEVRENRRGRSFLRFDAGFEPLRFKATLHPVSDSRSISTEAFLYAWNEFTFQDFARPLPDEVSL